MSAVLSVKQLTLVYGLGTQVTMIVVIRNSETAIDIVHLVQMYTGHEIKLGHEAILLLI